jgi:ribose transport system ATP-binding protein
MNTHGSTDGPVNGGQARGDDRATDLAKDPIIEADGISKRFGVVQALNNVSFRAYAGELHALCGENGAGKSTLMKVLAGSIQPDSGAIRHHGQSITLASPLEAKQRGILLIHQEISLVPELTVAENIFLGSLPTLALGRIDKKKLYRDAEQILTNSGFDLDAAEVVGDLSLARQQMVEIARAAAFNSSVVVFDEPTAALTDRETEALFANIERLKAQGVAIIYISHKMKEIFRLADRITVLRDGAVTGTLARAEATERSVTQLMIGRSLDQYFERAKASSGDEVLRLDNVVVENAPDAVSLSVRAGEVVGLYGLVGAGRSELAEAIFGLRRIVSGTVEWMGKPVTIGSVREAIDLGIGLVPEDRKKQGLVLGMGARSNTTLPILRRLGHLGFRQPARENAVFSKYRERLKIKAASGASAVNGLSGGNQQKIVLAKWLASEPKLLILDEPTRGIDVGAKAEIHGLISRLAESGIAIILISSEMPEIMGLSNRILTIYQGGVTGEFDGATATEAVLVEHVMSTRVQVEAGAAARV